jgi:DMSO/TMAO reductase YedYZ heme-binding membrane subunit
MNKREKLIFFYVVTILVFDIWGMSLAIQGKNNWLVYNILLGIEVLFLTAYLNQVLKYDYQRKYLNISSFFFFVYSLIHVYFFGMSDLLLPLSMLSGSFLSLFFLLHLIYGQTESKWINNPDNWISLGSILYLCGTIPFQALFLYIVDKKQNLAVMLFQTINMGLSHFRFLLIFIGFLMILKRKESKPEIAAVSA